MFADGIFGESLSAVDPELHAEAHGSLYISQKLTSEEDAAWSRFTADWPSFDTAPVNVHLPDAWQLPVRVTRGAFEAPFRAIGPSLRWLPCPYLHASNPSSTCECDSLPRSSLLLLCQPDFFEESLQPSAMDIAALEYDAVAAAAIHACEVAPRGPLGRDFGERFIATKTNISFDGLTGKVGFDANGDRLNARVQLKN
eukprot:1275546-Pleurochrysis_carterae.AAC.1